MYCPNCGANNTTEQNFCRSCGLNLEDTAKSLLAQIPSAESAELMRREQRLEKFGNVAWRGFGIVSLIGLGSLIYVIISGLILSGKNPLFGILLGAFITFAALTLAYVFLREDLKEKKKKQGLRTPNDPALPKTTGKFLPEKQIESVPSVVEDSTELLYTEPKTRRLE